MTKGAVRRTAKQPWSATTIRKKVNEIKRRPEFAIFDDARLKFASLVMEGGLKLTLVLQPYVDKMHAMLEIFRMPEGQIREWKDVEKLQLRTTSLEKRVVELEQQLSKTKGRKKRAAFSDRVEVREIRVEQEEIVSKNNSKGTPHPSKRVTKMRTQLGTPHPNRRGIEREEVSDSEYSAPLVEPLITKQQPSALRKRTSARSSDKSVSYHDDLFAKALGMRATSSPSDTINVSPMSKLLNGTTEKPASRNDVLKHLAAKRVADAAKTSSSKRTKRAGGQKKTPLRARVNQMS